MKKRTPPDHRKIKVDQRARPIPADLAAQIDAIWHVMLRNARQHRHTGIDCDGITYHYFPLPSSRQPPIPCTHASRAKEAHRQGWAIDSQIDGTLANRRSAKVAFEPTGKLAGPLRNLRTPRRILHFFFAGQHKRLRQKLPCPE